MVDYDSILTHLKRTETCLVLSKEEIRKLEYNFLKDEVVWEIKTEINHKNKNLEIIFYLNFPNDFPLTLPKIFIAKEVYEPLKYVPHVNKDFSICIFDEGLNLKEPQNVPEFVEVLIAKAKKIIRDSEDSAYLTSEFRREFKAYWEIGYNEDDKIKNLAFHSIPSGNEGNLKALRFDKLISNYQYYLYSEDSEGEKVKKYCDYFKVSYKEIVVLSLNQVIENPPYDFNYIESVGLIKKDNKFDDFKRLLRDYNFEDILVVFKNSTETTEEYYGWSYKGLEVLPRKNGGLRNNTSRLSYLIDNRIGKGKIYRLTFDNLSLDRLQMRTSNYLEDQKSIVITGLGSIGSNLIFYLKNLPVSRFHLVDDDVLSMENIKRHFSGFKYIGNSKTSVIEFELKILNPLYDIELRNKSVVDIVDKEPDFINNCNFHVVAIGKSTIEKYILENLSSGKLTTPTIFFWVEPFLAGGHMVVVNQKDADKAIKNIEDYRFSVLSDNQMDKTYLVEGSCQTGFFPYSSTNLIMFLSAIYPFLTNYINEGINHSKIFTWIGDKELIAERGLLLSDFGKETSSFEIAINDL